MKQRFMVFSDNKSKGYWDAQYLLALSYLNFDYRLNVILMPGSVQSCPWEDKQWQALNTFGLEASYHILEQPPIASEKIDWATAQKLLSNAQNKLLHLCHWENTQHFEKWLNFASTEDVLICFGLTSSQDYQSISELWPNSKRYIVNQDGQPHIAGHEHAYINHKQWAALLLQHTATLSWI